MHPHRIETVGFMFDGEEVARHFLSEIGAFSLCEKCEISPIKRLAQKFMSNSLKKCYIFKIFIF